MLAILKKSSLYGGLKKFLPTVLIAKLRPLLQWRLENKPEYDETMRQHIRNQLGKSSSEFLVRYGKSVEFWEGL